MGIQKFKTSTSGIKILTLGLGAWNIGGGTTADTSQDERAVKAIREAIELGCTHIDAAEMYGAGHTEELIGRAIWGPAISIWNSSNAAPSSTIQYCARSLRSTALLPLR
jgi:diketogulonate reductase-like aldo/keto reductase